MYQFKDNKSGVYYHEQKFTLQWNFPDARWVMVKYFNGNKRVVLPIVTNSNSQVVDGSKYKFLNFLLWLSRKKIRSYRYKRFFWRQAHDEFTNIANFQSQQLKLYVFSSHFPWIKKLNVPMRVNILRLKENKINVDKIPVNFTPINFTMSNRIPSVPDLLLNVNGGEIEIEMDSSRHSFNLKGITLDHSLGMLIQNEVINQESDSNSILSTIK